MAELETRVCSLEGRCTSLELAVEKVSQKVDLFVEESRAARERQDAEMREFRQKHDAEMREFRQKHDADMREFREKHSADMRDIRQNIDSMGKHVRNLTMTAMGGIVAAGVGIAAIVVAVLLK